MRIAVVGAGGVGGFYGAMLARAGERVTFIARGAHLEALKTQGLTLKSFQAGEFNLPVSATDDANTVGPVDLVLFCVKTYDTEPAAEQSQPLITAETVILPLQNGAQSAVRLGEILGEDHVIGGTTYISAKIESPGVINEIWGHLVYLGELSGERSERTERILATFLNAGITAEIPADIQVALWSKHLGISTFAALACVTRLPGGALMSQPETAALFWGVMEEGLAVAKASSVRMPMDFMDEQHQSAIPLRNPDLRPSMLNDLESGRRLELEDLLGVIVRLGEAQGVPTPLTFALYAALKPYENGKPAALMR